jgi:hypothetical protein
MLAVFAGGDAMNPVPPGGVFPTGSFPVDGYLHALLVAAVIGFVILVGIVALSVRQWNQERVQLFCPVRLRRVRAVFELDDEGRRIDVLRCSVFGRRPITCGKSCVHRLAPA